MLTLIHFCILLKNGVNANKRFIFVKNSNIILTLTKKLYLEGFIKKVELLNNRTLLCIELKYSHYGISAFNTIKLFSKPGKPFYISYKGLSKLQSVGVFFVSTPIGILSDQECLKKKIGGKIICYIN